MIAESILIIVFALVLDFTVGDPKNRFHPTAWIGNLIAKLTPYAKSSPNFERLGGITLVCLVTSIVVLFLAALDITINLITIDFVSLLASVVIGAILLKTTLAIKGMQKHALSVLESLKQDNIGQARARLALIVKRNTKNLDKNHILSGVLESISENTVDGITGPLFFYALFGLPGAFVYRVVNTIDSMTGYKNSIFKNVGWFGAKCDSVLNFIPARLTAVTMIFATMILKNDWRASYQTMLRDGPKTESTNAGYPMAALAGALGTRFEKINHYNLGQGSLELSKEHIYEAIATMKVTSILFCAIICIPIIVILSYLGWWIHA